MAPKTIKNHEKMGRQFFYKNMSIFRNDAIAYVKRMFLMVQALMRGIQGASRIGKIVTGAHFFYNIFESLIFNKNQILIYPQKRQIVWYIRHIVNVDCLVDPISALLLFRISGGTFGHPK